MKGGQPFIFFVSPGFDGRGDFAKRERIKITSALRGACQKRSFLTRRRVCSKRDGRGFALCFGAQAGASLRYAPQKKIKG